MCDFVLGVASLANVFNTAGQTGHREKDTDLRARGNKISTHYDANEKYTASGEWEWELFTIGAG